MRVALQDDRFGAFSQTVRKLAHLNITPLQAEILRELMNGKRTMAELTLAIFQLDYKHSEYDTYHSRVRRAVRSLEKTGLVSKKKLMGRNKPYGLTVHGTARIASILPGMPQPAVIPKKDYVLFAVTVLNGIISWITINPMVLNLFTLFLGMVLIRGLQAFRRVV